MSAINVQFAPTTAQNQSRTDLTVCPSLVATPTASPRYSISFTPRTSCSVEDVDSPRSVEKLFTPQQPATSYDYIGGNVIWLASKIARLIVGFWNYRWLESRPKTDLESLVTAYKSNNQNEIDTCIARLNSYKKDFLFQKEHFFAIEYALGRSIFTQLLLREIPNTPLKQATGYALMRSLLQAKYGEGFHDPAIATERDVFEQFFVSMLSRKGRDAILQDPLLKSLIWNDLAYEFEIALLPFSVEKNEPSAAEDVANDLVTLGYPKTLLSAIFAEQCEYLLSRIAAVRPSEKELFFTRFFTRMIDQDCDADATNVDEFRYWLQIIKRTNTASALSNAYQKKVIADVATMGETDQVTSQKTISKELATSLARKINNEVKEELESPTNREITSAFLKKKSVSTSYRETAFLTIQKEARKTILIALSEALKKESPHYKPLVSALELLLQRYDAYETLRELLLQNTNAQSLLQRNNAIVLLKSKNPDPDFCERVYKEVLLDEGAIIRSAIGYTRYANLLQEIGEKSRSLEEFEHATMSSRCHI